MALSPNDITYVLSGGSYNNDPDESLGGEISSTLISGKRLFDNVSKKESDAGHIDYRCFYITNDNLTESMLNASVYVSSDIVGGALVQVGFQFADDVQQLMIAGDFTGGSLDLTHESTTVTANFSSVAATFAENIQTALRTIDGLTDIVVENIAESTIVIPGGFSRIVFRITYSGDLGNRYYDLLDVENNLTPSGSVVNITKISNGAPINSIAVKIDNELIPPPGVSFESPTIQFPTLVGTMGPLDSLPVWIKRIVRPGTGPIEADGFTILITGLNIS